MKIAINCWVLCNKQLDGIGYFTVNTISRVIKNNPAVEFMILCDKNFTEDYFNFPNVVKYHVFPALRHPVLYVWYMEAVLTAFLKKHKPDLMVSMEGFLISISTSFWPKRPFEPVIRIRFFSNSECFKPRISSRIF